ncbi:MAG TPA: NUDIX hydrolase [Candidatus Binatia bacterium]|nr:NUDIX hydrolase [Candidatus Binatia bacterium]
MRSDRARRLASAAPLRRQVFRAYDGPPSDEVARYCPRCGGACEPTILAGRRRQSCAYCGALQYRNPLPAVAIAIRDGGRVLLGKRRDAGSHGGWALPAGFIEFDEDFLTAARRAAHEETGLDVHVTGILNVSTNFLSERLHALVIAVAALPVGGELRESDELAEVAWFAPGENLPALAYEADRALLDEICAGTASFLPVDDRYAAGPRSRLWSG